VLTAKEKHKTKTNKLKASKIKRNMQIKITVAPQNPV
jgi:hypothetical protein